MENTKPNVKEEVKEVKAEKPAPASLTRYPEIEGKVEKMIESGDIDSVLLLNELTLARNLEDMSAKEVKQFGVVFAALSTKDGILTRAGVYNTSVITDPEDAEDVLLREDLHNKDVLAVPRRSVFANGHFNK